MMCVFASNVSKHWSCGGCNPLGCTHLGMCGTASLGCPPSHSGFLAHLICILCGSRGFSTLQCVKLQWVQPLRTHSSGIVWGGPISHPCYVFQVSFVSFVFQHIPWHILLPLWSVTYCISVTFFDVARSRSKQTHDLTVPFPQCSLLFFTHWG